MRRLGAEVITHAAAPDGLNINDDCGSTHLDGPPREVGGPGADAGIALDGDADRCLAVDASGELVDGDQILAILALAMRDTGRLSGETVVATVMSNLGLERAIESAGGKLVRTAVGDRYVVEEMRRCGYNFGGEQSGHAIYLDGHVTGDGLVAGLLLCGALDGRRLSEAAAIMPRFPQVKQNLPRAERGPLTPALLAEVAQSRQRRAGGRAAAEDHRGTGRPGGLPAGDSVLGQCPDHAGDIGVVPEALRGRGHDRVGAPQQDQLRVREALGIHADRAAERRLDADLARSRAERALEARGAEAMEEAPVHRAVLHHAHGAGVVARQDGLGAFAGGRERLEPRGDLVQRLVPADTAELAAPLRPDAPERVQHALGGVGALEVAGDLGAQRTVGERHRRIALDLDCHPVLHGDQHRAGVGAVVRAGRANHLHLVVGVRERVGRLRRVHAGIVRCSASSISSIQCLTGVSVPACTWARQPTFAVAIRAGTPACNAPSLRARSSSDSAGCRIEYVPAEPQQRWDSATGVSAELEWLKFEAGEIDVSAIPTAEFAYVMKTPSLQRLTTHRVTVATEYLGMNCQMAPFTDVRVRQAFNYAINKRKLIAILNGRGVVARGVMPPALR